MEYENKELCAKCGGKCCIKSGCDYFVSDFKSIDKATILKALETGNISIVSAFKNETLPNGQMKMVPILYLRARNKGREVIDLFSMKKTCSMLTDTGCSYTLSERPSGGVNLIPGENGCKPAKSPLEELEKWLPYQSLLAKIVKRYTGMSVDAKIKCDVEEVFYDVLCHNFDGVQELEITDIKSGLPLLSMCFPLEYEKAKKRKENDLKLVRRKF